MTKKITMTLSQSSIQNAIKELKEYEGQLVTKCNVLCGKLAEMGLTVAKANISSAPLGKYVRLNVKYESMKAGCKAMLIATGDTLNTPAGSINTLLMIEFGSGWKFNTVPNPKASELGYGVGTYPNQTHAFDPDGWYYLGEDDKWHHSYGVKATMPMYNADMEILMNIHRVAREVFSK